MNMNNVILLNRSQLEEQLESQGLLGISEQLIERMKEHVHHIAKNVYEQFVLDVKMVVDNVLKNITAHFIFQEDDDGKYESLRFILFQDLTITEER